MKEQAKKELSTLKFPGDWMSNELEEDGPELSRSFRNSEFYTDRPGEEDDDWAEFTGEAEVLSRCRRHFSAEVLATYDLSVYDEGEKCWFAVVLREKK
jgi:hypothetical protein